MNNNVLEYLRLHEERSKSPISLIKTIWGCVVGLAGISIPLIGVSNEPGMVMLPIIGVVGATISSLVIWRTRNSGAPTMTLPSMPDTQSYQQLQAIQQSISDLRGYVMHLEQSIDDKQLRLAIDKAEKQAQQQQQLPPQDAQ